MKRYFVSYSPEGTGYEVHTAACRHVAPEAERIELGYSLNCYEAIRKARRHHPNVNGCAHCCTRCHAPKWGAISPGASLAANVE